MMLLALPMLVVHRIDPWSPLSPPLNYDGFAEDRASEAFEGLEDGSLHGAATVPDNTLEGGPNSPDKQRRQMHHTWSRIGGNLMAGERNPAVTYRFPDVPQRAADLEAGLSAFSCLSLLSGQRRALSERLQAWAGATISRLLVCSGPQGGETRDKKRCRRPWMHLMKSV